MMRNMLMASGRAALCAVMLMGVFATPVCAAGGAAEPVRQFQQALLYIMQQGKSLGFEGRKHYLAPMVDQAFDLPRITRVVIGRYWEKLNAAERRHLGDRIREYALVTLASRFSEDDGQTFTKGSQTPISDATTRVNSRFSGPDTDVALDYLVRRDNRGDWRISNVWFNGVSGTNIQQKEFASFLRKGGAARLIAKLDEIITGLSQEG